MQSQYRALHYNASRGKKKHESAIHTGVAPFLPNYVPATVVKEQAPLSRVIFKRQRLHGVSGYRE